MIEKVLNLKFADVESNAYTISLSDTRDDITSEEIKAVMDIIIANDIILSKGGALKTRLSANMVTRDTDNFEV